MIEIDANNNPFFKTQSISLDDLSKNNKQYPIEKLALDFRTSINTDKAKHSIYFSSKEKPIVYSNNFFSGKLLSIEEKYYYEHKSDIDKVLIEILKNVESNSFVFYDSLYNIEFLKTVCNNPNIKEVTIKDHILTKEEYEIVKNSSIESIGTDNVADELKEIYGEKIKYNDSKELFQGNNYPQLQKAQYLDIYDGINSEEINNIKYINDECKIKIAKFKDFDSIFKLLDKLKEFNKPNNVILIVQSQNEFDNKNDFNNYIFNHLDLLNKYKDLSIGVGIIEDYPLIDYVKYEKKLIEMIKPAFNLSPLEKYLYAYNVVKKYKEYKENEDNKDDSRHLYELLDNEYMVCVGYSELLYDLLTKLGIESQRYSAPVEVGFDKVSNEEIITPDDVVPEMGGHARLEVNLIDPKYGIDGYYLADPTWDNVMDKDAYNHALMSQDEYDVMDRPNYQSQYNLNELFFIHSPEEFYLKVNYYLDLRIKVDERSINLSIKKKVDEYKVVFVRFMQRLKQVDSKKYDYFNYIYKNMYNMKYAATNIREFHKRIKPIVNEINDSSLKKCFDDLENKYNSINYQVTNKKTHKSNNIKSFILDIIKMFKYIDNEMYNYLNDKYNPVNQDDNNILKTFSFAVNYGRKMDDYNYIVSDNELQEFITEVGYYVTTKVNKPIPGEILISAIREVYLKAYNTPEEEIDNTISEIIEYNKKRQEKAFPIRYMIDKDGNKVPIANEENKFDIEHNTYTK